MQSPPAPQGLPPTGQPDAWIARSPAERLREYLRIARRRWPVLAAVTAIVVATALTMSLTGTEKYDATAILLLRDVEPIDSIVGRDTSVSDPERATNTQIGLIKLEAVAEKVKEQLQLRTSTSDLLDQVTTEVEGNSDLVSVVVRDEDPRQAAAIATAFATEYVAFRRESARSSLDEAANLARTQLESLSSDDRFSTEGQQLEARLRELEIASSLQTGGAEIVRQASVPSSPAVPRPKLAAVIGLMVGFALALLVVVLLEFADRRLKDEDEAQATMELPLLAQIPRPARGKEDLTRRDRAQDEAFASLAANILFSSRESGLTSLMITSPSAGDGKTTTTLEVARALATLGKRVVAIEADLRHPRFAERLRIRNASGFAGLAAGVTEIEQALIEIDAETMRPPSRSSSGKGSELDPDLGSGVSFAVIPAGAPLSTPQTVLSGPTMGHVVAECRARADFVLIDTPPIGVVHDAITLANLVDAALLVSRLNWTTKDAARKALRIMRQLDVRVLGFALTGTTRSESYYHRDAAVDGRQPAAPASVRGGVKS
jgi:polysaccharide biosynthesis transport protein